MHGVHEHSSRYDHVLVALASKLDLVVHAFDAQSHGRSEDVRGLRGACNAFDEFVDDMEEMLNCIVAEYPGLPIFLFGQSFGGLVSTFAALRNPERITGLVLASPAINVQWSMSMRAQSQAAAVASKYTPDLAMVAAVRPEDMSKDPEAVAAYVNDPLNTIGNLRCRIASETLNAFKRLESERSGLTVPHLLVLFGDTDRCCNLDKAREFLDAVPCANKEFKVFDGMYHTLFHEPEKAVVINYLLDWLRPLVPQGRTNALHQQGCTEAAAVA